MNWGEAALWWLPTATVAAMTVLGLVAAAAQRQDRKYLVAAVLLGVFSVVVLATTVFIVRRGWRRRRRSTALYFADRGRAPRWDGGASPDYGGVCR